MVHWRVTRVAFVAALLGAGVVSDFSRTVEGGRASPLPAQRGTSPQSTSPPLVWRAGGAGWDEGWGRPAVLDEMVFFMSKRHEVIALDARTGALRWRHHTGEPGDSTFGLATVTAGDVVVVGDYNIVAFDRRTGAFRWRFVPVVGYAPGVYLGQTTGSLVLAGSPAGRAYALSAATGELVWTAVVVNDGRTTVFQPATDGAVVAVGFTTFVAPQRGGVALLDVKTGHELWRTPFPMAKDPLIGTGSTGGPIIHGDVIVASAGAGTVYVLNKRDGSVLWTLAPTPELSPLLHGPFPIPAATEGADYRPLAGSGRYLVAGSLNGPVVGYDLQARRQLWKWVDYTLGSVFFAIVADEHAAYLPFGSGRHVALDLATGTELWRTSDRSDKFFWPAGRLDDLVFLASDRGGFVAFQR